MNRLGNLLGYLPGSMSLTRPDTGPVSTWVGGSVTAPGSCSPHVRAIASRPDPSRPIQTKTGPGGLDHDPDFFKEKNGQTLSSVSAGVAREARAHVCALRAQGAAA